MARVPFTLRIELEEREALEHLSRLEGRPINRLLNEAIRAYLNQKGARERSLEADLSALRAYRDRDPEFRRARAAFVEAEATLEDPPEGVTRGIREFVARDWQAVRDNKDAYWAERIGRLGPSEALRIADELRRQALLCDPTWPDMALRKADLLAHVRLSDRLRRAGSTRRA